MKINYRLFPFPVLAEFTDDYIDSNFQAEFSADLIGNEYILKASHEITDPTLLQLIKDRKAGYALHVECASTYFRSIYTSFDSNQNIPINCDRLDNTVEVCPLIVAQQDISNYSNQHFHPDFNGSSFHIFKGDILAIAKNLEFNASKNKDVNVPSIFSIQMNNNDESEFLDVLLDYDRIIIKLSKANFKTFLDIKNSHNMDAVLNSLLIVPSLVMVLETLKDPNGTEGFEERRWFKVLANKLLMLGINVYSDDSFVDSSVKIAQQLVGSPIGLSLNILKEYEFSIQG